MIESGLFKFSDINPFIFKPHDFNQQLLSIVQNAYSDADC